MSNNQTNKCCNCNQCKSHKNNEDPKSADLTLPGFHYLGPGGKKSNGPPTNPIDFLAMKHDKAYDEAIDEFKVTKNIELVTEEIKEADEKFIEDVMRTEATTTKEFIGKAIGLVGIGIKASVEKFLGITLYPAFDKINGTNIDDCSTEVRAGDDFN